ncbi:hypothetical protein ACLGIH_19135 [Streptomyces sp. HMX87]|uniref:hypothetical protein n=1 Tax=Streptomyces sp. HMX87 TaxID=3390849 RepID=UPI003A86E551
MTRVGGGDGAEPPVGEGPGAGSSAGSSVGSSSGGAVERSFWFCAAAIHRPDMVGRPSRFMSGAPGAVASVPGIGTSP